MIKRIALVLLLLILWTGTVVAGALFGWWRRPIAPAGDASAFMKAAVALADANNRANAAIMLIEADSINAEYYSTRADTIDRHTVFATASLSKWITAHAEVVEVGPGEYSQPPKWTQTKIGDQTYPMQRGILDVTLSIKDQPTRFIGLHLKSKRIVTDYDQAELRVREAEHVRKHIDSILLQNPENRLIAYGDFNDHTQSLSTKTILGNYRSPYYLTPVHVTDQRGETWTYHFESQDSYSRIDFIAVSKSLKPHIDKNASRIIDNPNWNHASDHRAIMVSFR